MLPYIHRTPTHTFELEVKDMGEQHWRPTCYVEGKSPAIDALMANRRAVEAMERGLTASVLTPQGILEFRFILKAVTT